MVCADAVFALALSRFLPALAVLAIGVVIYLLTLRRFIAQMRDRPRPRWITRWVDLPLFAHFGASGFALLTSPVWLVIAATWAAFAGAGVPGALRFAQAGAGYAFALGLLVSMWSIWIERRWVRVRQISVGVANLAPELEGYRIVQLSDLHVGSFDPKERALEWVALANSLHADLAVVTGDLVTSGTGFYADVADAIAALRAPDGVFVSMGNHDQANNDELSRFVAERGPVVLRNTSQVIRRGDAQLSIAGLDGRVRPADIARVVQACPSGAPIVLLSHYPWPFKAAAEAGADLVLVGHTHGGQLAVPFFIVRPRVGKHRLEQLASVRRVARDQRAQRFHLENDQLEAQSDDGWRRLHRPAKVSALCGERQTEASLTRAAT